MSKKYREFLIKEYENPVEIPIVYKYIHDESIDAIKFKDMIVTDASCLSLLVLDSENQFYVYYPFERKDKLEQVNLPATEKPSIFDSTESGAKLFAYTSETLALIYENKSVKFFKKGLNDIGKKVNYTSRIPKKIIGRDGKFYILFADGSSEIRDGNAKDLNGSVDSSIFESKEPTISDDAEISIFGYDCLDDLWILTTNNTLRYYKKTVFYKASNVIEYKFSSNDEYTRWSHLYVKCDIPNGTSIVTEVDVDGGSIEIFENMPNMLLYDYVGKELNIKITLKSNQEGTLAPSISSMKVVINQKPYIDYLPAYYQKNKEVLSRYLSIFQNIMDGFEEKIEKSHESLDPVLCDEEYLEWLSSLLGIARDYRWSEDKWRNFLAEAPALYAELGTKRSMQRAIELYCDEKPDIKDDYDDKLWTFCVKLRAEKIKDQRDIDVIESIIEVFKPAHTYGRLMIGYKKEAFIVGKSSLTIDTQIK